MQEKVYQTHIANIDAFKHWLVRMWAELDHDSGDTVAVHV